VEYILTNFDDNHLPLVSIICVSKKSVTINELFDQFLNFKIILFENEYLKIVRD
jgi:hypothetical protein